MGQGRAGDVRHFRAGAPTLLHSIQEIIAVGVGNRLLLAPRLLGLAAAGRAEGLTPLETARQADLGDFAAWDDAERIVLNLHRAWADAEGRPLDVPAAFTDAMTWNGGPMTTHVCCAAGA